MDYTEQLNQILEILGNMQVENLSYYLQFLCFIQFVYSVILPLGLILIFGWWFFKQFLSRW